MNTRIKGRSCPRPMCWPSNLGNAKAVMFELSCGGIHRDNKAMSASHHEATTALALVLRKKVINSRLASVQSVVVGTVG